jgi:hypothetical protein
LPFNYLRLLRAFRVLRTLLARRVRRRPPNPNQEFDLRELSAVSEEAEAEAEAEFVGEDSVEPNHEELVAFVVPELLFFFLLPNPNHDPLFDVEFVAAAEFPELAVELDLEKEGSPKRFSN